VTVIEASRLFSLSALHLCAARRWHESWPVSGSLLCCGCSAEEPLSGQPLPSRSGRRSRSMSTGVAGTNDSSLALAYYRCITREVFAHRWQRRDEGDWVRACTASAPLIGTSTRCSYRFTERPCDGAARPIDKGGGCQIRRVCRRGGGRAKCFARSSWYRIGSTTTHRVGTEVTRASIGGSSAPASSSSRRVSSVLRRWPVRPAPMSLLARSVHRRTVSGRTLPAEDFSLGQSRPATRPSGQWSQDPSAASAPPMVEAGSPWPISR